jgi:hypothetical protein
VEQSDKHRKENEVTGGWGQEGGADTAKELLSHYDLATRTWSVPRISEFWDSVKSAHALGRFGDGHTIAVVDDGFDLTIPALAEQTLMWNIKDTAPSAHGTVVALLILEVAPNARLLLYPTATIKGKWDPLAIERALREVDTSSASIVNLSLGAAFPTSSVLAIEDFIHRLTPWPEMSEADFLFWISHGLGELEGWRDLVRPPPQSIFEAPIAALERSGRTVVAATGNARGHIYDPALRASVFSVSFHRVERFRDSLMEEAVLKAPTFSQSEVSDFGIIQPPGVLGSSFATPLIAGFAALMASRGDLRGYAEVARLAGLAEKLMVNLEQGSYSWSDRHDGVIDKLFLKAVRASPHSHFDQSGRSPCPECALFAASAFINYGLFKLNWGDLDGAETLLSSAEAFAPENPHAAANLGMVYAVRAQRAQKAGNIKEASRLLKTAAQLQQKASHLRPEYEPYQRRVEEFMLGAQHPQEWEMAP